MAWQSSTINPTTTTPAGDISKIKNDLQQLKAVMGGTPDAAIPFTPYSFSGARITGDFSNATLANRVMFQSSTANTFTVVSAIPSGTGASSAFNAFNSSDPTNSGRIVMTANTTEARVASDVSGTGTYLPMTFYTGGSETLRLTTDKRIQGDFSNATLANRVMFQTSTAGSLTSVAAIPNGGGFGAYYTVLSTSDTANTVVGTFGAPSGGGSVEFASTKTGTAAYAPMTFFTGGTERVRISAAGSVGIGITNPQGNLHIADPTAASMYFTDSGAGTIHQIVADGDDFGIRAQGAYNTVVGVLGGSTQAAYIRTNGAERMRIDATGNVLQVSPAGLGYGTGAGGTVTQATSKSTDVVLDKPTGQITTNAASLGPGSTVYFYCTSTGTKVTANDVVVVSIGDSTASAYQVWVSRVFAGGFQIALKNNSAGALAEAVKINFAVMKVATA